MGKEIGEGISDSAGRFRDHNVGVFLIVGKERGK